MKVILRWAVLGVLRFHPVDQGAEGTLRNVEHENDNSETLGDIVGISVQLHGAVMFHLVDIIEVFHPGLID